MHSKLFSSGAYKRVETKIREFLNGYEAFLSLRTAKSTRAVGDALQDLLTEQFESLLGMEFCAKYSADFARRAMGDLAFEDQEGFYYLVDVKTHRLSTKFNMPNLTSVERLARLYRNDKSYFVMLMLAYEMDGIKPKVSSVRFVPIEFLDWDCLTIGALGWGQIQIANSNYIKVNPGYARKSWMLQLCDQVLEFYPKEILKIRERIEYFRKVKSYWQGHAD